MQTISTKRLPCTNHKQSRIKATASGGSSQTIPWDWGLSANENHDQAARALINELGWDTLGTWHRGDHSQGCVYVCYRDERDKLLVRRPMVPKNWTDDMDARR